MAKKKKKIRGLCLVLSFVLSIGFCLTGVPGKKILADEPNGVDENAYLIVGDEVIVAKGVWADETKVEGDVYTSAKGFTVEKDPNRYDYRVELTPGGNYGAFFLSNVKVLFIPPESESENDAINIVKFNFTTENTNFADGHTNTVFDGILNNKSDNWDERIESQISGYSIYCMSGSIDFTQERASFPTYNLAGGIRIGNNNGLMFPEGTFNIGTSDIPAEVGIANAYQADEQLEPYNVFLKGSTNLTIYAETVCKFREEGKIRAIGISNANPEYLKKYLECGRVDIVQEKYSILDQKWTKEYLPLCRENQVTFQGFSVLERGLLAGKIGMDYEIRKGEARGSIGWFKPERRKLVLDMLEGWKPLCEKYGCSMANLVMAASLATEGFIALCGVRHRENLLDTMKSVDIVLSAEDLARIRSDCDGVIAAAAGL